MGLRSPVGAFSPEEFPSTPNISDMAEHDENHLGTDEESSKESSLQSSLQDSSLTELEGKMASTGIGAGMFKERVLVNVSLEISLIFCTLYYIGSCYVTHCTETVL